MEHFPAFFFLQQRTPHFHFAVGSTDYVPGTFRVAAVLGFSSHLRQANLTEFHALHVTVRIP